MTETYFESCSQRPKWFFLEPVCELHSVFGEPEPYSSRIAKVTVFSATHVFVVAEDNNQFQNQSKILCMDAPFCRTCFY